MAASSLPFDLSRFIAGQIQGADVALTKFQRDLARLTRAAWGTGGNLSSFRAASREKQEAMVLDWVQEAMEHAVHRRSEMMQTV